jgi:CubicO group peptidase (beta-lactamase class C family)
MAANIPASNIYSDARSLAELVQPLADDGRLRGERVISERALAEALKVRIASDDLVLPFHISWAAGVMRNAGGYFGPSATAYGHAGWGGSAVMFDPTAGLSVAYIMNKMSEHLVGDPRAVRIFAAAGESLASK